MKAIDSYTGTALSGVSISMAGMAYTTDSNGLAAATFNPSLTQIRGESVISKDGYAIAFFQNVNLDLSADATIVMPLTPSATPSTKSLTVTINEYVGTQTDDYTPLPDGRSFSFRVDRRDGSGWGADFSYTASGASIQTPCFGDDCMVSIVVDNWTTPGDSFVWHGVMDLSGTGAATIAITESVNASDYQDVSLASITSESSTHAFLRTPYGGGVPAFANTFMPSGSTTVKLFNPNDYTHAFWQVSVADLNVPATGHGRTLEASTDFLPLTGTVELYTIDLNVSTDQYPTDGLFSYDSVTGTLSSKLVSEGDEYAILGYTVVFVNNTTGELLGQGGFSGDSYVLPEALRARAAGETVLVLGVLRKDAVANLYYDAARDLPFLGRECPMRNQCLVWPMTGSFLYSQDIVF